MAIPSAIATGTVLYLIMGAVLLGLVFMARLTGRLSKDNAEIGNVVVTIATFSMWLFWFCAWMHQWHPLIKPIYEEK
jgi:V-type H+-transporting ATPase subunit e